MANSTGTLNPNFGTLRRGKYQVAAAVLLDLDKQPFLTPEELAQALTFYASEQGFDARGEAHSRENAFKKAQDGLSAFARGEVSEVPEDAAHLAERYYSIQTAVRYAHADWVKESGIAEFCAPILLRAVEIAERKFNRAMEREQKVAVALQIPFEASESALAIQRALEMFQMGHGRIAALVSRPEGHEVTQPIRIRHILADLMDWPTT